MADLDNQSASPSFTLLRNDKQPAIVSIDFRQTTLPGRLPCFVLDIKTAKPNASFEFGGRGSFIAVAPGADEEFFGADVEDSPTIQITNLPPLPAGFEYVAKVIQLDDSLTMTIQAQEAVPEDETEA